MMTPVKARHPAAHPPVTSDFMFSPVIGASDRHESPLSVVYGPRVFATNSGQAFEFLDTVKNAGVWFG